MKVYISENRSRGRFTGISTSPAEVPYVSIETDHAQEVMLEMREVFHDDSFEEGGVFYTNSLPDTVVIFVRDFIWKRYHEQGMIDFPVN